jgi:ornithine carbamoyltransferase
MKHLLTIADLDQSELEAIYGLALAPLDDEMLSGQGVALVFERPSLRTRASSSSAVHELGGYVTFFGDEEIGLDSRESAADVARTLEQMFAIAALRLKSHVAFERMRVATGDRMALINLLSDLAHPTQAIADVLTIAENFAKGNVNDLRGLEVAYVGDATNVTRSLAVALLRLGVNVRVGAPAGYQLQPGGIEDPVAFSAGKNGRLTLTDSAADAVAGANVVYTDAWISMGAEAEAKERRKKLKQFRVTEELMGGADKNAIFMHCLPAHRGDEVVDEVLDAGYSKVWTEVKHRRSAMIGALRWIKGETV